MTLKKGLFAALGLVCLVLGCIGIVLPILPTVPFFLATAFCFAKSSTKLHTWFLGTNMYKKHLESYVQKRGMTWRTKLTIMASVTVVMAIGFLLMSRVPVARVILAIVWVAHVVYFIFVVKTIPAGAPTSASADTDCTSSAHATRAQTPSQSCVSSESLGLNQHTAS
jgi:hypothetical protein